MTTTQTDPARTGAARTEPARTEADSKDDSWAARGFARIAGVDAGAALYRVAVDDQGGGRAD